MSLLNQVLQDLDALEVEGTAGGVQSVAPRLISHDYVRGAREWSLALAGVAALGIRK